MSYAEERSKTRTKIFMKPYLSPEKNTIIIIEAKFIVPCDPPAYV